MESKVLKGTTTIGLVCKDGIVFAVDKRASWGHFIASKKAKKAFKLNEYTGGNCCWQRRRRGIIDAFDAG
ncbi:hypothetical protein ACFLRC_01150 [Candidatus Altiarchaeota archaeon]